jgi:protein-S-isoprenylcysteine O-methyltransferase Ste14
MTAVRVIVVGIWVAFWLYWFVAALRTRGGGQIAWSRHIGVRVVPAVVLIVLLRAGVLRADSHVAEIAWRAVLGIALLLLGLGFAVWARLHIGRNWGVPMTQKEEPELVTSGPYRLVRHPIYAGILVGGIGTAVALGWIWLVAVVLLGGYFFYSATVEERYMTVQFPDAYPAYKRSTRMLLPFLL